LDRLPLVVGLLAACSGEGSDAAKPKKPTGRVNAVAAKAVAPVDVEAYCEPWAEADSAKPFVYPELSAGDAVTGKRRWVNVWATWCKPCIEELPRLVEWEKNLADAGVPVELVLLSVDGDPETVKSFTGDHVEVEGSLEIADVDALKPWLGSIGLSADSVLPIHLFVDQSDKIRCVRMAGVSEHDYEAVKQIIQQI
jgi:thiol-disulfide isomerase/thioredoxin